MRVDTRRIQVRSVPVVIPHRPNVEQAWHIWIPRQYAERRNLRGQLYWSRWGNYYRPTHAAAMELVQRVLSGKTPAR